MILQLRPKPGKRRRGGTGEEARNRGRAGGERRSGGGGEEGGRCIVFSGALTHDSPKAVMVGGSCFLGFPLFS